MNRAARTTRALVRQYVPQLMPFDVRRRPPRETFVTRKPLARLAARIRSAS